MRSTISASNPTLPHAVLSETTDFLRWLEEGNFVFLGMREYVFEGTAKAPVEMPEEGGLGLLRDPKVSVLRRGTEEVTITPEIRAFLMAPDPLIVTKANVKTRVHRRDYMDYVGVKIFEDGKVAGELRIVGLFTSTAFTQSAERIPLIRRKVADIVKRAGFDPVSHSGKALLNVLENYPRTELFQAEPDILYDSAMAILRLEERPRVRALPRRDRFDRFVSVLVFVPRDRYTSDLRERIGVSLARALRRPGLRLLPRLLAPASDARPVHHRAQSDRGAGAVAGGDRGGDPRHRAELRRRPRGGAERRLSAGARRGALARLFEAPSAPTTARSSPPPMRWATWRSPSGLRLRTSRSGSSAGSTCPRRRR